MKAIEFTSEIKNNLIEVPKEFDKEINLANPKKVKVILLIDEQTLYDEQRIKSVVQEQFLSGYADSDSVYDE